MTTTNKPSSSSVIDAIYLTTRCKFGSDLLKEVLSLLYEMEEAAYNKGASNMLEKVKADIKEVYENYHYPMPEALILELIDNALLSQYNNKSGESEKEQ